jgi:uncharacterized membrane protein (UPF0127 family)
MMAAVRAIFLTLMFLLFPVSGAAGDTDPRISVYLPSGRVVAAEIADTEFKKRRGLMFRERLGESEGMIFLYTRDDYYGIWMKNCLIPLDIVWMEADGKVLHIREKAPPCRTGECPTYLPPRKARYILEVQGGLSRREGLRPGARLEFHVPSSLLKAIPP